MKNIKLLLTVFILTIIFTGVAVACTPEASHSAEIDNCQYIEGDYAVCPTPSEVTPPEEPTVSPEPTVVPPPGNIPENPSDGRSDGLSSCPSCTQAPEVLGASTIPLGPPSTGHGE